MLVELGEREEYYPSQHQAPGEPMVNREIQATWHYHNGTKHPHGNLMDPRHSFDPSSQPLLFGASPNIARTSPDGR